MRNVHDMAVARPGPARKRESKVQRAHPNMVCRVKIGTAKIQGQARSATQTGVVTTSREVEEGKRPVRLTIQSPLDCPFFCESTADPSEQTARKGLGWMGSALTLPQLHL